MSDTIAAIATSSGVASISIVRVSGPDAVKISKQIAPKASFSPRKSDLTSLYNAQQELIDRALVVYFKSPYSFTGEDIVEFQCHGGAVVASEILDTLLSYGVRLAQPGEFSKRAFLNGKIDMSEAEAIAKLIEAQSVDAAKILARQIKGELSKFVDSSRDEMLSMLAHSEVMIDYAEEDIPDDIIITLKNKLEAIEKKMIDIVDSSKRRRGLIEGFRVAIVGKPNVGKSSILNALLSFDRAIVSDIAGTTRDTIEEQVRIGTHIIRLIDTAGIREASDAIEQQGVERSISSIEDADIVVVLFDGSREFDSEDEKILQLLRDLDKESIVAINKSDLSQKIDSKKLEMYQPINISAKFQFRNLISALESKLDEMGGSDEIMLVSARQIEAVEKTLVEIEEARKPLFDQELEFFSYHIQEAIKHLSTITKPYNNEEILDKMFGEFCLGK